MLDYLPADPVQLYNFLVEGVSLSAQLCWAVHLQGHRQLHGQTLHSLRPAFRHCLETQQHHESDLRQSGTGP